MGLTINIEPDLFSFAKNNILIAGSVDESDLVVTAGTAAYCEYKFTTAQGGMADGDYFNIIFNNFNNTGISKTIRFDIKNAPGTMYDIKSFSAYGKPLVEWLSYLVDCIYKLPYLSDNYNAGINTMVANQFKLSIGAKEKGALWNIQLTSPFFISGNYVQANSAAADTTDNLYLVCHLYKKNSQSGSDGVLFFDKKLFTLKCFLDANNNFSFSLNSDLKKYLETYLLNYSDTRHLGTEYFKFILEMRYRNNKLLETGEMPGTPENYLYQNNFYAILGGRVFYESIGKDINLDYFSDYNRKFITRRPKIVYLGECIFINDFIINNDDVNYNALYATVEFTYDSGYSEIMDIPNVIRMENKMAYIAFNFNDLFFTNLFSQKYPVSIKYQIKNLDRRTTTPMEELSGKVSETREIIFNRKPFRNNNYFRFYGSLGNSEFAWFNGKIEAEVEAAGIDFERDTSHVKMLYGDEPTIWKEFQFGKDDIRYTQKFKISTGYKSKEEIQWLTELIGSELIFWYSKNQMDALVDSKNYQEYDDNDLSYQVIVIDKNSIKYFDSEDELQAMSFEFRIAIETVAPHFTIKDKLLPRAIESDIFVIDIRQALSYREDFNPQVIFKIKNNYQIGDTITIEHSSLMVPIVSTIVAVGQPYVDDEPSSDNIQINTDITEIALQLRHVLMKYGISALDPRNGDDYIYFMERTVSLASINTLKVTSTFVEKQFLNCNNMWKYILNKGILGSVTGYTFANGSNNIYLHEVLKDNANGENTFYSFKYPRDLEDWLYCVADYFQTNTEFEVAELDERGLIKLKRRAAGPLGSTNKLLQQGMDKYIFISKLVD